MTSLAHLTGCEFSYDYRILTETFNDSQLQTYSRDVRHRFAIITKKFDDEANTEWLVRLYLSLKYILAASILASSAEHAEYENLKVVGPYLKYYTLFNCCRSFNLTSPDYDWRGQKSMKGSHNHVINSCTNALRKIDPSAENRWGALIRKARDHREMFSYAFPALGPNLLEDKDIPLSTTVDVAQILAELAQFNSECLYSAVQKHCAGEYQIIDSADVWSIVQYEAGGEELIDKDDWYRIGQLAREKATPIPITLLASEGLVEDFFGAWRDEAEKGYDPDNHWRVLLQFA